MLRLAFAAVATALLANGAFAQDRDTTRIPRELVHALFGRMGGELVAGVVPQGFPAQLLPAGATVLGGMRARGGQSLVAAVRVEGDARWAADSLVARLLRSGWRRPELPRQERGGFDADQGMDFFGNHVCSDSSTVNILPAGRGGSLMNITFMPSVANTPCDARMAQRMHQSPAMPSLRFPANVRGRQRGGGSSNDHSESRAFAISEMSALVLADSLMEQLRAEEWMPVTKSGDADAAIATARKKDDRGRDTFAIISVSRSLPDRLDLSFVVRVPSEEQGSSSWSTLRPGR